MKKIFYLIILSVLGAFYSCGKSGECSDFVDTGYSSADGSFENIEANATSALIFDEGEYRINLSFTNATEDCFLNSSLSSFNLWSHTKDTIHLVKSTTTSFKDYPSAIYYILDGDATPVEEYILLDTLDTDNWIVIDSINSDSTEMKGRFNMSFITGNEKVLSGERERWDDPNRPDTLHFTNGEFVATSYY